MRKNISSHKKPRELLPGALSTFMKYCAFFSHPDFTVGSGILTCASHRISRLTRVADFTAGREFQLRRSPCPEEFSFIFLYYITNFIRMQYKIRRKMMVYDGRG